MEISLNVYHGPTSAGESALPPRYYSALAYPCTLQMLQAFEIELIYADLWPTFQRSQATKFLDKSSRCVDTTAKMIWNKLQRKAEGVHSSL